MDDFAELNRSIRDPLTGSHLSYFLTCRRLQDGWTCSAKFDDGREQFSPKEPVIIDQLSIVPDRAARAALEQYRAGR